MSTKAQLRYRKLTLLLVQLIDKGFTDGEIHGLLDSLEELSALYGTLQSPPHKTVALLRERNASPKCPSDPGERFSFLVFEESGREN